MRPSILYPLFASVTSLKGVGPRMGALYKKLCGDYVVDLLWHLPVGVIDRSYSPQLKYADRDRVATLTVKIVEHNPPSRPSLPYRIVGVDDTDQIVLTYFNVKGDYLSRLYPADGLVTVSGLVAQYDGQGITIVGAPLAATMRQILSQRILVQGFINYDFANEYYANFLCDVARWISEGRIKYREDIVDGLKNAPSAFIGMLCGKNFGKLLVRVGLGK